MTGTKELVSQNGVKSLEYVQDSSSETGSDTDNGNRTTPGRSGTLGPLKIGGRVRGKLSPESSGSESETSSTASSSHGSSGEKRKAQDSKTDLPQVKKKPKLSTQGQQHTKPRVLAPPPGFSAIELGASDFTSETGSMFSNLDGKQVWHITAPASIPITSVKSLDVQAALRGEPILRHKETEYGMFATATKGESLLLPYGSNSVYSKVKLDVSKCFHLRELPERQPALKSDEASPSNSDVDQTEDMPELTNLQFFAVVEGSKKMPRQQPPGLLMRYQPYGSTEANKGPYNLLNPAADADKENDSLPHQNIASDEPHHTPAKTTKRSKKSKEDKKSKRHQTPVDHRSSQEDGMEIDGLKDNAATSSPQQRTRPTATKSDSERRRKRMYKEKA